MSNVVVHPPSSRYCGGQVRGYIFFCSVPSSVGALPRQGELFSFLFSVRRDGARLLHSDIMQIF